MACVILRGKTDAGNPFARFDDGKVVLVKPRRGFLLYKNTRDVLFSIKIWFTAIIACLAFVSYGVSINVTMPAKWNLSESASVSHMVRGYNELYCKCYSQLEKCVKVLKEYNVEHPKDAKISDWLSRIKKEAKSYGWKHLRSCEPARVPYGKHDLDRVLKTLKQLENEINSPVMLVKIKNKNEDNSNPPRFLVNGLPIGTVVLSRNENDYTCQFPDGTIQIVNSETPLTTPGVKVGQVSGAVRPGATYLYSDPDNLKKFTVPDTRTHRQKKQDMRHEEWLHRSSSKGFE